MELFGVVGRPILHSRSPDLHHAAFGALGMDARFIRLAALDAPSALQSARRMGIRGLNVTAPFKVAAAQCSGARDGIVTALGAANTLLWREGQWCAHNTDVAGVQRAIASHDVVLRDAEALVLGSGGAALAAAAALQQSGARVVVAARDIGRAQKVAGMVSGSACSLREASALAAHARVIVGAVSTEERLIDPGRLRPGTLVLEARYQAESALVRDARRRACVVVEGQAWLLHQAAEAFRLFTGRCAPIETMQRALAAQRPRGGAMLSLVGFMGVGKSCVARRVGEKAGLPVIDTDLLIAQHAGVPVAQLLRDRGEPELRRLEAEIVRALPDGPGLLACGGGLATNPDAADTLRSRSRMIVWLWADATTCLERIGDLSSRPLLAASPRAAARLLDRRIASYAGICDVAVDTEGRCAEEVADAIVELWGECA